MLALQSVVGIFALLAIAWLISENRGAVSWRNAAVGLVVTFVLALLFLKIPQAEAAFSAANDAVSAIAQATRAGTSFVFGYIGGGTLPFELKVPGKKGITEVNVDAMTGTVGPLEHEKD